MAETPPIDFDSWTAAVFAGQYPGDVGIDTLDVFDDPSWVLVYCTRLFTDSSQLRVRYSPRQLRVGFNALMGTWDLSFAIWQSDIAWTTRQACILSMAQLFKHVFAHDPLNFWCEMWWEHLRHVAEEPDPQVEGALMVVLEQILQMSELHCQHSALHGLGHLRDPKRAEIIHAWLRDKKPADPQLRDYALCAAAGKVL